MKVSVRLFTTLRELAGKGEERFDFESKSVTVKDVLDMLGKRHGKSFREYLYDEEGHVREHLQLLVNGKSISLMEELNTRLKEGDQVAIIPPVGGG